MVGQGQGTVKVAGSLSTPVEPGSAEATQQYQSLTNNLGTGSSNLGFPVVHSATEIVGDDSDGGDGDTDGGTDGGDGDGDGNGDGDNE